VNSGCQQDTVPASKNAIVCKNTTTFQ